MPLTAGATPLPPPQVVHVAVSAPAPEPAWQNFKDGGDDLPSQRLRRLPQGAGGAAAHSLGISAMVLGVVGLLLSLIPCVGWIGLPLSGIGLLLGGWGER